MDRNERRGYLLQFIAQGVDYEQACRLVYADAEDIATWDVDESLQAEIQATRINLAVRYFTDYGSSMSSEAKPADHLKRLQTLYPEAFKPQVVESKPMDLNLTIVKVRGKQGT